MLELGVLLIGSFLVLTVLGVPIAVSLGLSSLFAILYTGTSITVIASIIYAGVTKYSLLAIPFFILAGMIMDRVGISKRLIHLAQTLLGGLRSGLAIITVVVAVFFAAISGSGPATVAALGVVLIPAMVKQGYPRGMAGGLLSAAGSIGIIIPPSIAFIIYASIAQVSVGELFIAGVIPGITLALAFIICSLILLRGADNSALSTKYTWGDRFRAFKDAFWGLMAPVIILGGIYGGVFTPTEAAGVAVVYSLLVGIFIYRELSLKSLFKLLVDSVSVTAGVMYIVAFATVFAYVLTMSTLARSVAESIIGVSQSTIMVLLLINLIFLIAGFFLDSISAYFIFLPMLLPVAMALEVDPIHFGVIVTVNLAIGQFTPPVGVNLFVAANVGKIPVHEIVRAVVPYIVSALVALLLITFIPEISLWLPSLMGD